MGVLRRGVVRRVGFLSAVMSLVLPRRAQDGDAAPAMILASAARAFGATTGFWSVATSESGGTVYIGVAPSGAAALTAQELITGSGGSGVAFDNKAPAVAA